jgi:hypothetical protein
VTTLDDELRHRFSELEATLLPQVGGADLTVVQRRGRTWRAHRALAVAAAAALLVTAVAVGARLYPFAQPGLLGPVAPSMPPPSTQPPTSTMPRAPQSMVLTDRGLTGIATFGDPMDRVLTTLRQRLGLPDEEVSNENNPEGNIFGVCPGGSNRYVRWGRLWVLFTAQSRYGQGRWHLFAYYVKGAQVSGRPDPATQRGIHVGSTVAELRAAYGPRVEIFPIEVPPVDGFRIGPPSGPAIDGLLSSTTANGRVTQLHGGQGCGE